MLFNLLAEVFLYLEVLLGFPDNLDAHEFFEVGQVCSEEGKELLEEGVFVANFILGEFVLRREELAIYLPKPFLHLTHPLFKALLFLPNARNSP
jgi:hypothetical protein